MMKGSYAMRCVHRVFPAALAGLIVVLSFSSQAQQGEDSGASDEKLTMDSENVSVPESEWPEPESDMKFGTLIFDQLEYRANVGNDTIAWDAQGWYGGDINRLWIKSEGEVQADGGSEGDIEVQLLYSRMIAAFWDFQAGLRVDQIWGSDSDPNRVLAVIGFQGLAPYLFEVEPTLFISEDGDISARLTATADLLITQKLILQPRFESEVASRTSKRFGVGEGLEYVELGLRLRYEVRREFAPYIGVNWLRQYGKTSDLSRADGSEDELFSVVAGLRLWF
jgi:copper resistance protein B